MQKVVQTFKFSKATPKQRLTLTQTRSLNILLITFLNGNRNIVPRNRFTSFFKVVVRLIRTFSSGYTVHTCVLREQTPLNQVAIAVFKSDFGPPIYWTPLAQPPISPINCQSVWPPITVQVRVTITVRGRTNGQFVEPTPCSHNMYT